MRLARLSLLLLAVLVICCAAHSADRAALGRTDDLRILDIDGHHVFLNFTFDEMGPPYYYSS